MKSLWIAGAVLSFWNAGAAWAGPSGSAKFVIESRGMSSDPTVVQVEDDGGKLFGLNGEAIYLQRQNGGYNGLDLGRPFDLFCTSSECSDNGSTQVDLAIRPLIGGYELDGMLDYLSVHAINNAQGISISIAGNNTETTLTLIRQPNGTYSGSGASAGGRLLRATLSATGTLAGLSDPAALIVCLISPLIAQ